MLCIPLAGATSVRGPLVQVLPYVGDTYYYVILFGRGSHYTMQISIDESRRYILLHESLPSPSKRGKAGSYTVTLEPWQAFLLAHRLLRLAAELDPIEGGRVYCPTSPPAP